MVDALEIIHARRSIGRLTEPAPDDAALRTILQAAVCAPDHDELRPWRFIVLRGAAKDAFGAVLADAYVARCASGSVAPTEGQLQKERTKLGRAPLVLVVAAARVASDLVPWIEQQMAAAAAAQNALLAATALGFGSMWRTGDPAHDDEVKAALGLRPEDAIVGFLYLGTPHPDGAKPPRAPSPVEVDGVTTEWKPS